LLRQGLARDLHVTGFPDFEQFYHRRFRQVLKVSLKSGASADSGGVPVDFVCSIIDLLLLSVVVANDLLIRVVILPRNN
jgi:hypothetical protein